MKRGFEDDDAADSGKQQQQGARPTPPRLLPPPSAPMQVAREFVRQCLLLQRCQPDALTLRYWQGGWWIWRTSHWSEVEDRQCAHCSTPSPSMRSYVDERSSSRAPARRKIGDLLEALGAIVILSDESISPCWIDGRLPRGPIVAVRNGLLMVPDSAYTLAALLQPDYRSLRL